MQGLLGSLRCIETATDGIISDFKERNKQTVFTALIYYKDTIDDVTLSRMDSGIHDAYSAWGPTVKMHTYHCLAVCSNVLKLASLFYEQCRRR
jgi:hypothetical protein